MTNFPKALELTGGILEDSRIRMRNIIAPAAAQGMAMMKASALAGLASPLYLYVKPSTDTEDGQLVFCGEDDPTPPGHKLVTGEALRCNVAYDAYFGWIYQRSGQLPLFATGK